MGTCGGTHMFAASHAYMHVVGTCSPESTRVYHISMDGCMDLCGRVSTYTADPLALDQFFLGGLWIA